MASQGSNSQEVCGLWLIPKRATDYKVCYVYVVFGVGIGSLVETELDFEVSRDNKGYIFVNPLGNRCKKYFQVKYSKPQ